MGRSWELERAITRPLLLRTAKGLVLCACVCSLCAFASARAAGWEVLLGGPMGLTQGAAGVPRGRGEESGATARACAVLQRCVMASKARQAVLNRGRTCSHTLRARSTRRRPREAAGICCSSGVVSMTSSAHTQTRCAMLCQSRHGARTREATATLQTAGSSPGSGSVGCPAGLRALFLASSPCHPAQPNLSTRASAPHPGASPANSTTSLMSKHACALTAGGGTAQLRRTPQTAFAAGARRHKSGSKDGSQRRSAAKRCQGVSACQCESGVF